MRRLFPDRVNKLSDRTGIGFQLCTVPGSKIIKSIGVMPP